MLTVRKARRVGFGRGAGVEIPLLEDAAAARADDDNFRLGDSWDDRFGADVMNPIELDD